MMVNILGPEEPAVKICFLRMSGTSVTPCSAMSRSKLMDAAVHERVTVCPWERLGPQRRTSPPLYGLVGTAAGKTPTVTQDREKGAWSYSVISRRLNTINPASITANPA